MAGPSVDKEVADDRIGLKENTQIADYTGVGKIGTQRIINRLFGKNICELY